MRHDAYQPHVVVRKSSVLDQLRLPAPKRRRLGMGQALPGTRRVQLDSKLIRTTTILPEGLKIPETSVSLSCIPVDQQSRWGEVVRWNDQLHNKHYSLASCKRTYFAYVTSYWLLLERPISQSHISRDDPMVFQKVVAYTLCRWPGSVFCKNGGGLIICQLGWWRRTRV